MPFVTTPPLKLDLDLEETRTFPVEARVYKQKITGRSGRVTACNYRVTFLHETFDLSLWFHTLIGDGSPKEEYVDRSLKAGGISLGFRDWFKSWVLTTLIPLEEGFHKFTTTIPIMVTFMVQVVDRSDPEKVFALASAHLDHFSSITRMLTLNSSTNRVGVRTKGMSAHRSRRPFKREEDGIQLLRSLCKQHKDKLLKL